MYNVYSEGDLVRIPQGVEYYSKEFHGEQNSYRLTFEMKENTLGIYAGHDFESLHKVIINDHLIYVDIDDIHEGDTYVDKTNRSSRRYNNKEI